MTTYVPLRQRPIVAVRLKSDLVAAKGDWVGIDPEDSSLVHLTNERFVALYGRQTADQPSGKVVRTKSKDVAPAAPPAVSKLGRTVDGILTTQGGRFFYLLRRHQHPVTAAELAQFVDPLDNPKSISAAFAVMRELGLVESHRVGLSVFWKVTDRGCVAFDRLGPACFTKYGRQVPPDRLPPTDAERLALAWQDRHSP